MTQLWLTVDAAADALGVSPTTVRRRIKADKLDARTNTNGVTEVLVDTDDDDAESALNPHRELNARRQSENSDDQRRANPWIRAARPGEALLADRRQDEQPKSAGTEDANIAHNAADSTNASDTLNSDSTPDDDPNAPRSSADQSRLEEAGRPFTPADLTADGGGDELARFQRIAGASMLLAQQQATDAREQVALARSEAYRLRRLCYASWAVTAAIALVCFGVTVYLGYTASSAAARADASDRAMAEQFARRQAQSLAQTRQAWEDAAASGESRQTTRRAQDTFNAGTTADVRRAPYE